MTPFQVIVLATPVFLLLIGLEFAWGLRRERLGTGRNTYRLNDAINSISLGVLSQLSGVFSKLLTIGIYSGVYASVALFPRVRHQMTQVVDSYRASFKLATTKGSTERLESVF
jgi:hypothetical protein